MNKEEVYDSLILPHMEEIIKTCKEHKIAMIASFALPAELDPVLACSTIMTADTYNPPPYLIEMAKIIMATKFERPVQESSA